LECDGRYQAMLSHKMKNYALLAGNDAHIKGWACGLAA
jgi:hypothetical protein